MNKLGHIAFIMDGNGRWGKKKNRSRNFGHFHGVETVKKIVKTSIKLNIPIVSFYVFSSENWRRPKSEINFLFNLISSYFEKELENVIKNKIKVVFMGRKNRLPAKVKKILNYVERKTSFNKKLLVNLAINYGSKNEIIDAFKNILRKKQTLNAKNLEKNLYTKNQPDPDILVRTGGKKRLSNFMLWQLSYSEIYFLDKLWPDFNEKDLIKIIKKYKITKRNFGRI